ncbi:DUF4269 domain-containing protein [Pedobacter nototheniae]|uniref:DUF4269 domain-containing protein n=1 Tax=Pedobacter nototheniae TaxID=2488994 RepID=UPI00292E4D1C|nr:DUF4269 domain-containing protein [Pedobacter nototheniae]
MINFLYITYLQSGTAKQAEAYHVLTEHGVLEKLSAYAPILVGTIPINIDIESSDLDIICYAKDEEEFKKDLNHYFSKEKGFSISENAQLRAIKANFFIDGFELEIFGQNRPTQEQNAYRHLLIEYKLLLEKGDKFRQEVIDLKKQGYKTEPAFAKLLNMTGNPYEALLKFGETDFS